MNRRNFLTGPGLGAVALVAVGSLPGVLMASSTALLKGTDDGRILRSEDGGITWFETADFGDECEILQIRQNDSHFIGTIGIGHFYFELYSVDGFDWSSTPRDRPSRPVTRRWLADRARGVARRSVTY